MRVLITTGIFEPESGGPATYTAQIANELISKGHSVDVITFSDKETYDFDKKFGFSLTRVVRKNKISNYFRMFFLLLKETKKYDLVYSLDWLSIGLPLAFVSKITKTKYILRIGGGYIWERYLLDGGEPMSLIDFYNQGIYKKYKGFYKFINFVFKNAKFIIFNSEKQKNLFLKHYDLEKNRTVTIFNPIPNDLNDIKRGTATKEIVFAGRFIVMKNISSIIKAFKKANLQDYRLVLIGDGPVLKQIKNLVLKLDLKDRVKFLPRMRKREVFLRVKDIRYLIMPSWTDIQPMQFYEAVSVGIPVLLTKENYLNESNQISLKIDPNSVDDIAEKMVALSNNDTYKEFSLNFANIKVERGWYDVAEQHLKVFKKTI